MIELKRKIMQNNAYLFAHVGTAVAARSLCMGWLYRPEVPEILKGPIKKKKGVV